jgi:hypothetical protein
MALQVRHRDSSLRGAPGTSSRFIASWRSRHVIAIHRFDSSLHGAPAHVIAIHRFDSSLHGAPAHVIAIHRFMALRRTSSRFIVSSHSAHFPILGIGEPGQVNVAASASPPGRSRRNRRRCRDARPALSRRCRWPSHATIAPTRSIRIAPDDLVVIA